MRIGIDIDDTVALTTEKTLEIAIKYGNKIDNDRLVLTHNELKIFFKDNGKEIFDNLEIKKDAKEVINELKEMGHEIYFITARSSEFFNDAYLTTKVWLDKNKFTYDKLITEAALKGEICKNLGIEILIDDTPIQCYDVIDNNIDALLFDNNINRQINNIKRVNNWNDILQFFKEV